MKKDRPILNDIKKVFAKQREEIVKSLTFVSNVISGIYIIINIKNNMTYVGSSQNIELRWREHINKLYGNRHENDKLQKAWNKYGDKAFQFKILEAVEINKLIEKEQIYLDLYKPYERHIGYNLYKIAYSPLGNKWTEEQKANLRESRKGRWENQPHPMLGKILSIEEKETLSRIHKERYEKLREEGKVPPQTGTFSWSEEDRKKMSETRQGRKFPKEFGEAIRQRRLGSKKVNGHMVYPGDANYPE
jgi:group I intron endonuclease